MDVFPYEQRIHSFNDAHMNSVACTSRTIRSTRRTPALLRVATAAIALVTALCARAAEQRGPGAALRFDGTNGVVLLQNPAAPFSNPAGSFTIELQLNKTDRMTSRMMDGMRVGATRTIKLTNAFRRDG